MFSQLLVWFSLDLIIFLISYFFKKIFSEIKILWIEYHWNWTLGWCSLVIMVVIFFINAHMLIPTISGILSTKEEQKEMFSMMFITFNYDIRKDNTWIWFQLTFFAAFFEEFPQVHYVHQCETGNRCASGK
jgi:hypothetical protein